MSVHRLAWSVAVAGAAVVACTRPGGSVVAGRLIVAYTRVHPDTTEDVVVRTGS